MALPTTNLYALYEADAITGLAHGDRVAAWEDGQNSYDLAASGDARPTYHTRVNNGLPAVYFDGTGNFLDATTAANWKFLHDGTAHTVFVVFLPEGDNPNEMFPLWDTHGNTAAKIGAGLHTDDRSEFTRFNNLHHHISRGGTADSAYWNYTVQPNRWNVACVRLLSSNRRYPHVDKLPLIAATTLSITPSTSDPAYPLRVGAYATGTKFFKGWIAFIAMYNADIGASNADVYDYLGGKYDLHLCHSVVGSPATSDAHYAFPGCVVTDDDAMLVVYRAGTTHASDKGSIAYKTSAAAPWSSWSAAGTINTDATYDSRTCACVCKRSNGDIVVPYFLYDHSGAAHLIHSAKLKISTDHGANWGSQVTIDDSFDEFCHSPWVTEWNGDLLATVCGRDEAYDETYESVEILTSTDSGDNWTQLGLLDGNTDTKRYNEASITVCDSGRLLVLIREVASSDIYFSYSDDAGTNWSEPASSFDGSGFPSVYKDRRGKLWCVYRQVADVRTVYRTSTDEGATWSGELYISPIDLEVMTYGAFCEDGKDLYLVWSEQNSNDADVLLRRIQASRISKYLGGGLF